jgi:hypothetical protein
MNLHGYFVFLYQGACGEERLVAYNRRIRARWANDQPTGLGVCTFPNGEKMAVLFAIDPATGRGSRFADNGSRFFGSFVQVQS